ncbi:MAG: hypothetical protein IKY78_02835 [Clostridia bacterium]|nr:hypothetical protein [Clostridia bacterium]
MQANTDFFLGANTPKGFVSFFDELYNPYKTSGAYIIKGGPGTGKSTFMKKIADELEKRGISVERVHCSSDPQSLDGVIAPDIGFSIADGTSPHVLEPKFPGAAENILNLGEFWDNDTLKTSREDIIRLSLENSLCHRRCVGYLSAAGSIDTQTKALLQRLIRTEKLDSFVTRFTQRELKKTASKEPGRRFRRFLSAVTPDGTVLFEESLTRLAYRVIALEDRYGAVSPLILQRIADTAVRKGYDVIICSCPLDPSGCEHIIIPDAGIALITLKNEHPFTLIPDRTIHCDRFLKEEVSEHRQSLRLNLKLKSLLVAEAVQMLKKARETHDLLEKEYRKAMDFDALGEYTTEFINKICAFKEI